MISIDQRILLVFASLIIVVIVSVLNNIKYPSIGTRFAKFIQLQVLLFPVLDLKLPPAELNLKCFEIGILLFSIINFSAVIHSLKQVKSFWAKTFFLLMLFLAISSENYGLSLITVIRLFLFGLLILFIKQAAESGFNFKNKVLIPIVLWAILFFIIQTIFGLEFTLYQSVNETATRDLRYTSFAQDPQKFAQLIFMIAILFLGDFFLYKKPFNLIQWTIIVCCILMGLVTGARGPLVGFVIGVVWLILSNLSLRTSLLMLGFIFLASFLWEYILNLQTFQRLDSVNQAFDGRLQFFWFRGWSIFLDNFWLGIGPGNFLSYVTIYHQTFTYGPNGAIVDQPESGYLLWLCENGIIGFSVYLIILFKILIYNTKQNFSKPHKMAIIVWMVGFITVYSLSDVKILFLLALCIGLIYKSNQKPNISQ